MLAIAPTDLDWFQQLRQYPVAGTINFWTPTPWGVKQLKPGHLFYFLLKSPIRKVGGWGTFVAYEDLPASDAWNRYGLGNGVSNCTELVARTTKYVSKHSKLLEPSENPVIGCILLENLVFLEDEEFIDLGEHGLEFPKQVVKLKYFEEADSIPTSLREPAPTAQFELVPPEKIRRRKFSAKKRKGQADFTRKILMAYNKRCAITSETCLETLQAAHIQSYVNERSNHVQNGLCLRADLHQLFDNGLFTVNLDSTVGVSSQLRSSGYKFLNEVKVSFPAVPAKHPAKIALDFHKRFVFRN